MPVIPLILNVFKKGMKFVKHAQSEGQKRRGGYVYSDKKKKRSVIQSVLFDKKIYNKKQSMNFLKKHNFKNLNLDETKNKYRYRQLDPTLLKDLGYKNFRIKKVSNGLEFILANL